jgi:hypothetical protein
MFSLSYKEFFGNLWGVALPTQIDFAAASVPAGAVGVCGRWFGRRA